MKDSEHRYFLLNSPIIKKDNDLYGPVRFMHNKHMIVSGDCTTCHHYRPEGNNTSETVRCRACHQEAFHPDIPERTGLKAAYHLKCLGCHKAVKKGPVNCTGCHAKNVPDHGKLVQLTGKPKPSDVTKECLRCHQSSAEGLSTSAHWLWRGPSINTRGREKEISNGKATNTMNNFCIALSNNWPRCTSCHAGYGWKDKNFDFSDRTQMDCLVCHDTTGTYNKTPQDAGMPDPSVDLIKVAQNVGKPSRQNCGDCHFEGGGGDSVKHADMNSTLFWPNRNCDVHMGGYDFNCHECHKTQNHHIRGRSTSLPVAEGGFTCEACHTENPHSGNELLDYHLNKHTQTIACNTCHAPLYAKCKPTKTFWDWSKAGDKKRKPQKDKYGKDDYLWKKGEFRWKESAKPEYAWFNGNVERYLLGDTIESMNHLKITAPVGNFRDPQSKIHPFKVMRGVQPVDPNTRLLLAPHLYGKGGYWKTLDWDKSFKSGMTSVGLKYSGEYTWISTEMYWLINHEVTPKNMALSCATCHTSFKEALNHPLNQSVRTCNRCHQDNRDINFEKLVEQGIDFQLLQQRGRDSQSLIDSTDYINFKALGYKGDPIIYGGRFKKLPLGWKQ
ncbi:MAG: tetrathionate reductase family octaheme c-type cytochrome [Candidatus Magnetomorum sp.]|nr:tetrathionate reductase family octaheme c-type cytochrome [Candidatus Magnetomorum sp.]